MTLTPVSYTHLDVYKRQNTLYQNEQKHKIGVDGWTVEQNLVHRKKYAPDILGEIKDVLDEIEERGDLLPDVYKRQVPDGPIRIKL